MQNASATGFYEKIFGHLHKIFSISKAGENTNMFFSEKGWQVPLTCGRDLTRSTAHLKLGEALEKN